MQFLEPKNKKLKQVGWEISERTREVVKQYAIYSERAENEVADEFLLNILGDKKFIDWIAKKRSNKRIVRKMGIEDKVGR